METNTRSSTNIPPNRQGTGKRRQSHSQSKKDNQIQDEVRNFWLAHYKYENEVNTMLANDVYIHYQDITSSNEVSLEEFQRLSTRVPWLTSFLRKEDQQRHFKATPKTIECAQYYRNREQVNQIDQDNQDIHFEVNRIIKNNNNNKLSILPSAAINDAISLPRHTESGKRKLPYSQKQSDQRQRSDVFGFWSRQYKYDNEDSTILANDIYQHYQSLSTDSLISFATFVQLSNLVPRLRSDLRKADKQRCYKATTKSLECANFHRDMRIRASLNDTQSDENSTLSNQLLQAIIHHPAENILSSTNKIEESKSSGFFTSALPVSNGDVTKFMYQHYNLQAHTMEISLTEIFKFYQSSSVYRGETMREFIRALTQMNELKQIHKLQTNLREYTLEPKSRGSIKYHNCSNRMTLGDQVQINGVLSSTKLSTTPLPQPGPVGSSKEQSENHLIDLHLINIKGLIYHNINKCSYLNELFKSRINSKIIGITETWAHNNLQAEVTAYLPHYNVAQCDRNTSQDDPDEDHLSKQGGVMLLSTSDLPITTIQQFSNGNCELLITELPTISTTVIVLYRPSGINFKLIKFQEIMTQIKLYWSNNFILHKEQELLIMGDFNFRPDIVEWHNTDRGLIADYKEGITEGKQAFRILAELMEEYNLEQKVDRPTRQDNILDLIFTTNPEGLSRCATQTLPPEVTDHKLVSMVLSCHLLTPLSDDKDCVSTNPIALFNFKAADPAKLTTALRETNWDKIINPDVPVTSLHTRFTEALLEAADTAEVPLYRQYCQDRKDNDLVRLNDLRLNHISNLTSETLRSVDRIKYQTSLESLNQQILARTNQIRSEAERRAIENILINPKHFFRYAKKHKICKNSIGPLRDGTTFHSGERKMAEILSNQFTSVFTNPTPHYEANKIDFPIHDVIPIADIVITENDIKIAMEEINPSSAPGPDDIPAYLYTHYSNELAYPASLIWRISLDTALMPEGKILSHISPIFKKGDKSDPANYRPVSLTNHITKIFERVLRKQLIHHLEGNNLINDSQHGFRTGHSTVTQVLTYYDSILSMLEQEKQVEAVYLDFAKAFDKVDHQILLVKLYRLGIRGNILKWITTFLTQRRQVVKIRGQLSSQQPVLSGVPQGSVLGPLLFLVMMVDIDDVVKHSNIATFADDTKIWGTFNDTTVINPIQNDLDHLYAWAKTNNMEFNNDKFDHLVFSQHKGDNSNVYNTPDQLNIATKETVKDLGIEITRDGCFKTHILNTVKAAQQLSQWILRTFKSRETTTMKTLLKSLIIPKVEYACAIWAPHDHYCMELVENVQMRFTRRIRQFNQFDDNTQSWLCHTNYWKRLRILRLYSLQRRRDRGLIILLHKMVIGLIPCIGFKSTDIKYNERRKLIITPPYRRKLPKWVETLRAKSFPTRAIRMYNLLPDNLRPRVDPNGNNKETAMQFKKDLDRWITTIPDEPYLHDRKTAAPSNLLEDQVTYMARNKIN